jgi:polyhydroxyalkanoate synthesis regulator protein
MSTKNLSDARLAVHQRIASALVDLFAGGEDYTEEDVETADDITDEIFTAIGLEVIDVLDGKAIVAVPLM